MTDIALRWNNDQGGADLALLAGDLMTDDGLVTAIIISLFTDGRARDDDVLPDDGPLGADRRGWWGDALPDLAGDQIGSRLWLLSREKRTADVLVRAETYAREALAWLLEDRIASAIDVTAEIWGREGLAIGVILSRPGGPARERFDFAWTATALEIL